MRKSWLGVPALLVLAGLTLAQSVPTYKPGQAQMYRQAVAVVDSAALDGASVQALPVVTTGFNQVVRVQCLFTVASATCKLHFVRFNDAGSVDVTSTTASADARITFNSKYLADSIAFDTGSFKNARVLCEAPSSGTVDLVVTICGGQ